MLYTRVTMASDHRYVQCRYDGRLYWLDVVLTASDAVWTVRVLDRTPPIRVNRGPREWWFIRDHERVREMALAYLQRVAANDAKRVKEVSAEDQAWRADHEALAEYLTMVNYPDGGQRRTGTLTVFYDAPEWRVCLNDRDTDRSLWATGESLPEALQALDSMLREPDPPFRKNKAFAPNHAKKK